MGTLSRYHATNLPALLDKISKNSIGMDSIGSMKRIWDYILPDCSFDIDRWNLLTELPI